MAFLVHQLLLHKEGQRPFTAQRQNGSVGCGKMPPQNTPVMSMIQGKERNYITVIPKNYQKDEPKKLIFAFHGRTNSNTMVRGYYGIEQASIGQAIIVYPEGLPAGTSSRNWSDPGDPADAQRDFVLFDQLREEFSNNYCIDLDEVYVVTHSLGAYFANALGCFRGDVIRGVGSLGGGTSLGNCSDPVAAMIWHNPKDNLVSFQAGLIARDQFLKQNQCGKTTLSAEPLAGNCIEYQGCYEGAPVIWCPHTIDSDYRGDYYPHAWPNITGQSINTFFKSLSDQNPETAAR